MPEELGRAYVNLSAMLDAAGRLEESAAVALEGEQACRRLGLGLYWGAFLTGNAVEALIWLGRWDEAEALLSAVPMDDLARTAYVHLTLESARLALYRGDLDGCEAIARRPSCRWAQPAMAWRCPAQTAEVAAELAIARGRPDDAREAVLAGFERESEDFRYLAQLAATGVAAEAARPQPGRGGAGAARRELDAAARRPRRHAAREPGGRGDRDSSRGALPPADPRARPVACGRRVVDGAVGALPAGRTATGARPRRCWRPVAPRTAAADPLRAAAASRPRPRRERAAARDRAACRSRADRSRSGAGR